MLFSSNLLLFLLTAPHSHSMAAEWPWLPYREPRPYHFQFVPDMNAAFPQDRFNCILKDSVGFLWAGTDRGLLRYDGSAIKSYRRDLTRPTSLSNEKVRVLHEDAWGFLWIGTHNGLNRLDRRSGNLTLWQGVDQKQEALPSMNVWSLASDHLGWLWVGTEKGLAKGAPGSLTFENVPEFSGMAITALCLDSWGQLWVGTEDHGLFVSSSGGPWKPIPQSQAMSISCLLALETTVLVGTWNCGLFTVSVTGKDLQEDRFLETASLKTIISLAQDPQKVVWAGLQDRLLYRSPESSAWQVVPPSQFANLDSPDSSIAAILPSGDDLLWVATDRGGLHFTDLRAKNFRYHLESDLASLSFFQARDDQFWVGTTSGLATFKNGQLNPRFLKDTQVHNLHQLKDGRLLAATTHGLFTVDPETGEEIQALKVPRLWRLSPKDADSFWIASDSGLRLWHPEQGVLAHYQSSSQPMGLSHDTVSSLAAGRDERLWVGTFGGGLNLFEPKTATFTQFKFDPADPNSLSSNSVVDLQIDSAQNLWIATGDGGVNRLTPETGKVTRWTKANGLPDNTVVSLAIDRSGILWLGTGEGLVRMDPQQGSFYTYSKSDGFLIGGIFSGSRWQDPTRRLLVFGGTGGAVSFDTDTFLPPTTPPIVFTEVYLDNSRVADLLLPDEIFSIPQPSKSMSLDISLLEFRSKPASPFQFQREFIDDGLSPPHEGRQVSYTGYLPFGGRGLLDVVAKTHYLDPVKQRLLIQVGRPWWVAWLPFGTLLGLGLLISLIAAILNAKHRKKQLVLEQKTLLAQSQQALAEARARVAEAQSDVAEKERRFQREVTQILQQHLEQVSTELSNDVHDGPLGSVHALAFRLRNLEAMAPAGPLKTTLGLLSQETVPALADRLRGICGELLKPDFSAGLEPELLNYLEVIKSQAPELEVEFSFTSQNPNLPDALQATLYRIFRTLLKNLVKHALAHSAQIHITADSRALELRLEDNGCGFEVPPSWQDFKERGHFGLYMAHYFAQSAGGTFQVRSSPGSGTQFKISLPVTEGEPHENH